MKIKNFCFVKDAVKRMKRRAANGKNFAKVICDKEIVLKHTKNSFTFSRKINTAI